ncbi:MAG: NrsF family protein [Pseudomonadota bacterium]
MRTEDLIGRLAEDVAGKPAATHRTWFGLVAGLSILSMMTMSGLLYGLHPSGAVTDAVGLAVWLTMAGLALLSLRRLRMPEPPPWSVLAPLGALSLLLAVVIAVAAAQGASVPRLEHVMHCLEAVGLLSIVPFLGMSVLMRRGAPGSPILAGALVGLVSGAIGALGYTISCPIPDPLAAFSAHAVAVLSMALLGALVGWRLYAW